MAIIKGITVVLHDRKETGRDPFNHPIYEEIQQHVENVLVAPISESEILDTLNLTGSRAVYQLGIPKGDEHDWHDKVVEFFGSKWHTIGDVMQGIDALIPLDWNKKVRVERYDGKN